MRSASYLLEYKNIISSFIARPATSPALVIDLDAETAVDSDTPLSEIMKKRKFPDLYSGVTSGSQSSAEADIDKTGDVMKPPVPKDPVP